MTTRVGPTEDTPATPGWVEQRLDEVMAALPPALAQALATERDGYLDCLAGTTGPEDPLVGRERCHAAMLRRLRADGLDDAALDQLHEQLERLEAELGERT
jgi:hypothetical protein